MKEIRMKVFFFLTLIQFGALGQHLAAMDEDNLYKITTDHIDSNSSQNFSSHHISDEEEEAYIPASEAVLNNSDLLPLILDNLYHFRSIESARSVCSTWQRLYPTKRMILLLKEENAMLWQKLKNLKKFTMNGKLKFIDRHTDKEDKVNYILIRHRLDGEKGGNFLISPFYDDNNRSQSINPLEEEEEKLFLSTRSIHVISGDEIERLKTKGFCYASVYSKSIRYHLISVNDLIDL